MTDAISAYPLQWPAGWPRTKSRKAASFGKGRQHFDSQGQPTWMGRQDLTVADAVTRVLRELEHFNVAQGDAVISTNLALRLDGLPRSNQGEPSDPGAAVYWRARGSKSTKVMAVDRYDRVADNIAAIAATLNAMRAIERHGGAQILERAFTGFTALPGVPTCWDVLGLKSGATPDEIERAFRDLAKRHHPDAGGSHDEFVRLQTARQHALGEHANGG